MDFKNAPLEFAADPILVHRHRYPDSRMVACELSVPMFCSEILEGDLPIRLSVYLNSIVRWTLQFHLRLIHIGQVNCDHDFRRTDEKIVEWLNACGGYVPS